MSLGSIAGTLTDTQHGNRGGGTLHSAATASTAGFMSASDKAKLDGIQSGAEVNQNAFASVKAVDAGGVSKGQVDADAKTDMLTLKEGTGISLAVDAGTDTITIATTGGGLPAAHASTHITGGTDVIPDAVAGGASGLMSGADKQKLDGIQAGAEVNQNAFSNVLVGGTTIAADSKTDTLELVAGTNIALMPDATNDKVTIAVSGTVASASNADTVDGKHASDLVLNAGSTPSIQAGADASKPAAGTAGRLYIATDTQIIYRDSGSAWVKVGVVRWGDIDGKPTSFTPSAHKSTHASGGSDALSPSDIGAETPSGAQAKVDAHAVLTSVHGATSDATAGRIIMRDSAGRAKVAAPTASDDIARKDTVDAHANRTDNPHRVTAAQVGAVSKAGDDMGANPLRRLMLALDAPHSGTVSPLLNDLAYAHATAGRTVTVSPAPTAGAVGNMFNENSISYAEWSNTTPLPVTVQIDFTFDLHYSKVFAISFPWSCSTRGVKIEVYDNNAAAWVTIYDNASFSGDYVVVRAHRSYVRRVKFTFYGAYNSTALRVSRLVMTSSHYCGMYNTGYVLSRGGGDVAGPITVQGNTVWHAGNDGAGSGLDADLLDGYHASSFAVAPIPVTSLKTARGSAAASAGYVTAAAVHQYAFASPASKQATANSNANAVTKIGYCYYSSSVVRQWLIDNSYGTAIFYVTWDYLTSSGHPQVWAIVDEVGNIIAMWEAEDPVDEEFPDECPFGLTDERGNSIIPVGGAVVPVQFPSEQQLVALKGILAKAPMPKFASRGIWVNHKTSEEIVQTIFDKEMQSRGLEPIPDVREALSVQDIDKRNWRIQLWLRAVSRVRKDHRAFTLIPLFEEMFRVDKRTGKLEFK